jgi:hypothetical protein
MKSALVFALIVSMVMPAGVAAQESVRTWSSLHKLQPGVEVVVTTSRHDLHYRHFAGADDSAVTLLNLSTPGLSADVARLLQRALVEHPEYFPLSDSKTVVLEDRVSLDSSGVFVAGRKVAEYGQMVERIVRADIESGTVGIAGPIKRPFPKWGKAFMLVAATAPIWIYPLICATQRCD